MSQLLPDELRAKLLENNLTARDTDLVPVVKWFTPWGAATWLITEMEQDGDTCFGLCDLGVGEPELGYVSLTELTSVKGPHGLWSNVTNISGLQSRCPLTLLPHVGRDASLNRIDNKV